MATIKKYIKKDGSTAYQFNAYLGIDPLTGKKKRTTRRGFKTQKEAKLALAKLQLEIESKGFEKKNYSTFIQVYELWFSQYIHTVKPVTHSRIEILFRKHILPIFGEMRVNKITIGICQDAVNSWSQYFGSFKTLKSYTQKLFDFAITQGLMSDNPMRLVIMPKKQKKVGDKKINYLHLDQLKNLLEDVKNNRDEQDYMIVRLLAFTGMRKGEMTGLTWEDIDFDKQTIRINKTIALVDSKYFVTTTKTTASDRTITVDEITMSLLKKWKHSQKIWLLSHGNHVKNDSQQLVFSRTNNEFVYHTHVNRLLKHYTTINPHGLRHTHASMLFEAGATIKEVQHRLGQADIKTTMNIYTHVTETMEKTTVDKLSKFANF